jgi:hypothetical protein
MTTDRKMIASQFQNTFWCRTKGNISQSSLFFFFLSSSEIAFHEWHIWWQLNLDQAIPSPLPPYLCLCWSPILASFPSLIPDAPSTLSSSSLWLDQYTNRSEAHACRPVVISSLLRPTCWTPRRRLLLSSSCIHIYWDRRQPRLFTINTIIRTLYTLPLDFLLP